MKFSLGQLANLSQVLKELSTGLNRLDLGDNFVGFQTTVTIAAGAESAIRNKLAPHIPTKMLVLNQTGNGLLTNSGTPWTTNYVYVVNNGAVSVTATILFQK